MLNKFIENMLLKMTEYIGKMTKKKIKKKLWNNLIQTQYKNVNMNYMMKKENNVKGDIYMMLDDKQKSFVDLAVSEYVLS
nr:MAG: hypothetical protein CM15mV30_0760 [uncultured marine virus]